MKGSMWLEMQLFDNEERELLFIFTTTFHRQNDYKYYPLSITSIL